MLEVGLEGAQTDVTAGRTTVLDFGTAAGRIVTQPEGGHASINPDGTVALVMRDPAFRGAAEFEVEIDGKTVTQSLNVVTGTQASGWGEGDHYMLERDDAGRVVTEVGENHRKVFVSASEDALSRADIAAREGIAVEDVDKWFLKSHPEYGGSEDMALDSEAGMMLWKTISGEDAEPNSNWLLLESGYVYDEIGRVVERGASGESPLHPMVIGAWGEGEAPVLPNAFNIYQDTSSNIVIRDIRFDDSVLSLESENLLFDGVEATGWGFNIQHGNQITLHNSQVYDVARETPANDGDRWSGGDNKVSGVFIRGTEGLLVEKVLADHNGWADGYDPAGSLDDPQPPSKFSHNFYLQKDNGNVTFRDNVTMDAASTGAQIRSGGFIENNAFVSNNVAANIAGGYNNKSGNYSLVLDNLVTLAAYHDMDYQIGAPSLGMEINGYDAALLGNIITHLTDPTDTAALEERTQSNAGFEIKGSTSYDDTILYNWTTEEKRDNRPNLNQPEDIPAEELDATTVKSFVTDVLGLAGGTDGVDALSDWLRANWETVDGAKILNEYFQSGFGKDTDERDAPTSLRFVPDERGPGMRWDNSLNWSTGDKPIDGDKVDLGGNWVQYGGETLHLSEVDLGDNGVLSVRQGKLETDTLEAGSGAEIQVGLAGQIWVDGYAGPPLDITVTDGRFANTGAFAAGGTVAISGGEALLAAGAAVFSLSGNMEITGARARVGFDGPSGTARLVLEDGADLSFVAGKGGVATISEFRSGAWGTDAPGVTSYIDLGAGSDTTLTLDLGSLRPGETALLMQADTITGGFATIDNAGSQPLSVRIDHGLDIVTASRVAGLKTDMLEILGSADADTFVVSGNAQTTVFDYGRGDVVDLSAALDGLGSLSVREISAGRYELLSGGAVVAEVTYGTGVDTLKVEADGAAKTFGLAAASGPAARPGALDLDLPDMGENAPDPEPTPEPGPEPDPIEPEPQPEPGPIEPEPTPEPANNSAPKARAAVFEPKTGTILEGQIEDFHASDPDGDPLTFELISDPRLGILDFKDDGSFVYNPNGEFNKLAPGDQTTISVHYKVTDPYGASDIAKLKIKVTGADEFDFGGGSNWAQKPEPVSNSDPKASAAVFETETGTILEGQIEEVHASDPRGDPLTFELISDPRLGILEFEDDGSFVYNPNGEFNKLAPGDQTTISVHYKATDPFGASDIAKLKIKVTGADEFDFGDGSNWAQKPEPASNSDPKARAAVFEMETGTILEGQIEEVHASDPRGDPLTFELISDPRLGILEFEDDGSFVYNPNGEFNKLAPGDQTTISVHYKATDPFGASDIAKLKIKVTGADEFDFDNGSDMAMVTQSDLDPMWAA